MSDLFASRFDADVVYAAFNNHKNGDFKPYLLRSADRGRTWTSIAADLPGARQRRGPSPRTRRAATCSSPAPSSALFFTPRRRQEVGAAQGRPARRSRCATSRSRSARTTSWSRPSAAASTSSTTSRRCASRSPPTSSARRSPFPVKRALAYIPSLPLRPQGEGVPRRDVLHRAQPALRRRLHLLPEGRDQDEAEGAPRRREGGGEEGGARSRTRTRTRCAPRRARRSPRSSSPCKDADGNVVRRLTGPVKAGVHRVAWDLRFPAADPTSLKPGPTAVENPFYEAPAGPLVVPGTYTVVVREAGGRRAHRRSASRRPSRSSRSASRP